MAAIMGEALVREDFGDAFRWGVATAAFQIEGGVRDGGRGPSAWDVFSHQPGRVRNGDTADVACDHFHRFPEDVALMRELGVTDYRLSFAWSRIQPDDSGVVNRAGLDFYEKLVDGLLEAGIAPVPTLFHWDTPQWIEEAGGWRNRAIADRFAEYAAVMAETFGDRIDRWMTLNEPSALTFLGYGVGLHAPGQRIGLAAVDVAANQLLAHGRGVQALRAARGGLEVGIAMAHSPIWAAADDDASRRGAAYYDALHNRLFSDPLLIGNWPEELGDLLAHRGDDLSTIFQKLDWYGVNYYHPTTVGAPGLSDRIPHGDAPLPEGLPFSVLPTEAEAYSDFGWPVVPEGLTQLLTDLKVRYGDALPPVYITENGTSSGVGPSESGVVDDRGRVEFLRSHLAALRQAQREGVDVGGYFHWSLLDNFEWAEGYAQRFGLVHVDFDTLVRTPKSSYRWYQQFLRSDAV